MGLRWKCVDHLSIGAMTGSLTIAGHNGAPSKRWWNLWRFRQKWSVLEIEGREERVLFFCSASQGVMQLREIIRADTKYVAARIGPDNVIFIAQDVRGRPLTISLVLEHCTSTDIHVMSDPMFASRDPKRRPYLGEILRV